MLLENVWAALVQQVSNLLALDQSSHVTGYAVFLDGKPHIISHFEAPGEDLGDRLEWIRNKIISLIKEYNIDEVVFEDIQLQDVNGNILYENKDTKESVLNSSLAYIMNESLTSTYNYNFINYSYPTCYDLTSSFTRKYSIKTGTTDSDHLVFGYNKDLVVGLWSGYDDNSPSEVSNGKQLRHMWRDIMENYLKDKDKNWYKTPDNVVGVLVDPITGKAASKSTKKPTVFYYIKGTEPTFDNKLDDLIPTIKEKNTVKKK